MGSNWARTQGPGGPGGGRESKDPSLTHDHAPEGGPWRPGIPGPGAGRSRPYSPPRPTGMGSRLEPRLEDA